jgi:PAS domain S-box-containing protein
MNRNPPTATSHPAAQVVVGLGALGLVTLMCFQLSLSRTTTAFAYLILVVLLSLMGSFTLVLAVCGVALACLNYFFTEPLFVFRLDYGQDLPEFAAFLVAALVVTGLVQRASRTAAAALGSEHEIRALRDELRLAVDTIPALVASKLPDGAAAFLNRRFRDHTGLSLEEGLGWGWMEAFHPDDRAIDEWRAALATGEPFEKEARLRRADGEYRWFVFRLVPLRDEQGRVLKWYETGSDIEDRKQATAVLRSQARLLDLTHDTVFVRDMHDVITYWNRGAVEAYGWETDHAIGKVTHELLHTTFPEPLADITEKLLRTDRWEGELVHTKRDRTQVTVASRWALQRDEQGNAIAILETNNDVTERKRAEEALRHQADLLEQTHDAIIVWDFPGTICFWNRGAQQLYGYSKDEAVGRLTHDLLRTEHPMPTEAFEALIERERMWSGELTHTRRDGRKVVVDSRHMLVERRDGRQLVLETNRDISERKQAEYLTQQVFEVSPDAVSIIGRDYRLQRVNPMVQRLLGMPADRLVGRHVADVIGAAVFEQIIKSCVDRCFAGEEGEYAQWFELGVGRRYFSMTFSPLRRQSDRAVEAALSVSRDLTEHVLAAEALREAQVALAHVTRVTTLGEVTASFAHELNQPLAAIVNNANACLGLLPSGRPDLEEVQEALADIVSDAGRASAIIERVRGLAKRSSPETVRLRLADVVNDVVALAASELAARGVTIRTDVAADLPVVLGDRVQLQQVLLNLVVNGMDAMSTVAEGKRVLEIRGNRESEDGAPVARISVKDHGIGLHAEQGERLFEAFYTTKAHGMGMGLAISRSIIEAHGGRLWALRTAPWATFCSSLPAAATISSERPNP